MVETNKARTAKQRIIMVGCVLILPLLAQVECHFNAAKLQINRSGYNALCERMNCFYGQYDKYTWQKTSVVKIQVSTMTSSHTVRHPEQTEYG